MSSVLKPSLTASNSPVPPQLNKPMHPQQGPPQSYGQPSNHHSIVSHGNPTAAHNHSATHQPNHYALNVPNSFIGNNQPIPASNHPIPNNPSQLPSQQMYSGAKNMSYQGGYQPNLGHPQNQPSNQLPPVSQSLPATNSQTLPNASEESLDKSQSNGTTEVKSNHTQENHVTTPKEIPSTPALPTQSPSHSKPVEAQKSVEQENPMALDSSSGSQKTTSPQIGDQQKDGEVAENSTPKEAGQNESEASVQSDKKTEENEDGDVKDGKVSGVDEKTSESKREPSVAESESANTPNDSEKAVSGTPEAEPKEKPTPKRSNPRKTSRVTKTEEDSKPSKSDPKPSPSQKSPSMSKSKRARIRTQPYQSPLPELEIISKITASQRNKTNDEKLIVFFKNEFLAVRNPEGSFYVCQAVQNIYKSSAKIRIRWLSLDKNDKTNQIYIPDFYDHTDFDCILTNLNLERIEKGKFKLPPAEKERTDSILKRSLAAEKGEEIPSPTVNEEHPDGLDLSLYKDENQLNKRRTKKRKATSPLKSSRNSSRSPSKSPEKPKVAKTTPKPTKKAAPKKETPAVVKKATPTPTAASKKSSGSRTERAKRRSDAVNSTKVTPVSPKVDQKKAKALAKVARKSVVQTPKVQTPVKKETKETKPAPAKTATKTTAKATTSTKKKTPKRSAAKK